eukprot:5911081-Amphidinium_carterae.2
MHENDETQTPANITLSSMYGVPVWPTSLEKLREQKLHRHAVTELLAWWSHVGVTTVSTSACVGQAA